MLEGATVATLEPFLFAIISQMEDAGVVFVAALGPALVGGLAIVDVTHPMTGRRFAEEICWFVQPAYRRGRVGPTLLAAAEAWARGRGLTTIKMVAPADTTVGRFYERVGYRPIETAYLKPL